MKLRGFDDVDYVEYEETHGVKIAILRGGFYKPNPKEYMDYAVYQYVGHRQFNQYIEQTMDNPWVRVIIFNFNDIPFDEYER